MATFEDYWDGNVRAELSQGDFSPEMLFTLYRGAPVTTFCNRALTLYYDARRSINLCRDSRQQASMVEALEDAATEGSGQGVSDLREAFQHLADYQGSWFDDNVATYSGGPDKFFNGSLRAPESLVNFADAVDEATEELKDVVEQFTRIQTTVADSIRQAGGGAHTDWSRIGDAAASVSTWTERAGHLLWLADSPSSVRSGVSSVK